MRNYWNFFFKLAVDIGLPRIFDKIYFLKSRCSDIGKAAPEELIGLFIIAWRCLYATIIGHRLENKPFDLQTTKKRALYLILSRLKAYGKNCKDFCNERKYTGRKHILPRKLFNRQLIKVQPNGIYHIHQKLYDALNSIWDRPWSKFHKLILKHWVHSGSPTA